MTGGTLTPGTQNWRVMQIRNNCHLIFENITFTGGKDQIGGGGLYITGDSSITLKNGTRIIKNTVTYEHSQSLLGGGGGIFINKGKLIIDGAEITANTATGNGIENGGGLCIKGDAEVIIESGLFTANEAYNGGGVYVGKNATLTMNGGTVSANNASDYGVGGGLLVDKDEDNVTGDVKINSGQFNLNTAGFGGGIYVSTRTRVEINGGIVQGNKSTNTNTTDEYSGGGGIYVLVGVVKITGGIIQNNEAAGDGGGGIRIGGNTGDVQITGGIIKNNIAASGGGIYVGKNKYISTGTSKLTLDGGEITGNTAATSGGGVFVKVFNGVTMTYISGKISGNIAPPNKGKAIYKEASGTGTVTPPAILNDGTNTYRDDDLLAAP